MTPSPTIYSIPPSSLCSAQQLVSQECFGNLRNNWLIYLWHLTFLGFVACLSVCLSVCVLLSPPKVGLAIEGGGMRGCVSAGMVAAVSTLGLMDSFDAVYGSSAGSLVGAYAIAGQVRRLLG